MTIQTVGVIGAGTMGSGIAQVCAQAGIEVTMQDIDEAATARGLKTIAGSLARLVKKGSIDEAARDAMLARVHPVTDPQALAACDLVIEAATENEGLKEKILRNVDALVRPGTIIATNTSSISITKLAAVMKEPERFVGMHFFNPVPVMALVEVVRTVGTDPTVIGAALEFVRSLGKEPIECRDGSGFVVNLLLVPYLMDAIRALDRGVASVEAIDRAMVLGTGHPMGPLALCDFVGLDSLDRIGEIMYREYREQRYASPPLLRRMVSLGRTGRKSGRGFYDYAMDPPVALAVD